MSKLRKLLDFVNPRMKAGRIPLGRTAIVVQLVGALIFLGYTFAKKDIGIPFTSSDSYEVQVLFPDAKGLDPLDGPAAAVAGSPLGEVTEVEFVDGRALATLELDAQAEGKIFADATASLRPASALQNLLVNIDPGTPEAGRLPEGRPIQPENTDAFVSIDELTSAFDADTQAYMQILITEAELALRGRSTPLRRSLGELGELVEGSRPLARTLAERRRLLTRLVGNLDVVFGALAKRGDQLGTVIDSGSRTLAVTASRSFELEAAARDLAPLLAEARRSLGATRRLTAPLLPALDELAPASRTLPEAAEQLRAFVPPTEHFLDQVDTLSREGAIPVQLLLSGTENLSAKARELIPVAHDLSYRAALLDKYKTGAAQFADTYSGVFSINDGGGPYGQVSVLKSEPPRPGNFGMGSEDAHSRGGGPSRMDKLLAKALELMCASGTQHSPPNPYACALRFSVPGLPPQPLTADAGAGG